jgi:site-specific recombinase XerD
VLGRHFQYEEKELRLFDRFLADSAISSIKRIRPEVIDSFMRSRCRPRPRSYNHLLGALNRLFRWLVTQEIIERSPVKTPKRRATRQRLPFVFRAADTRRLLEIAGGLPDESRAPLRGPTYRVIFALLYGLGLRVGEASRLERQHVDLGRNLLLIRAGKFRKDRLVPFGPKIRRVIEGFLQLRGDLAADTPIFSFTRRGAVHPCTISQTFHRLVPLLGLTIPEGVQPPSVHCLRHSFAIGTLLRWYKSGVNPAAHLFQLSTFMGHVNPSSTAYYLNVTSELLDQANGRFEPFARRLVGEVPE